MILKFCRGSLQDLVKKPDLWTQSDDFNDSGKIASLSLWLQEYIDDAIQKANDKSSKESALFGKLVDIASREDWNGILLLKAKIEGLPPNLSGIMAGVDKQRFFAHYLGIEANHIDSSAIDIKGKSSVFGAIYYSDSSYLSAMDGDFYFRVKDLGALFENSALKSFESRVELVMKRIMDHPVLKITTDSTKQDTTSIILKGSCQKKEDGSTGSSEDGEDIVFVMDSDESYSFYLDSNILRRVEMVKAQMSMAESTGSDESVRVTARFDFWGFMDFFALKYKAKVASTSSSRGESCSAMLVPLDRALNGQTGVSGEEVKDASFIPVDMEVSNDIWVLPETFAYTVKGCRAEEPEKFTLAAVTDAPEIKLFDIFSYGNEYYKDDKNQWAQKDEARKGLCFSGLGLLMSYIKGAEAEKTFSFDHSRMAFDPEKSTAREGSLARQFGLKVEGFNWGDKESKPDAGGFVKVGTKSRGPGLSSLDDLWYGLRFGLNMGTLGELAGKAGLHLQPQAGLELWSQRRLRVLQRLCGDKAPWHRGSESLRAAGVHEALHRGSPAGNNRRALCDDALEHRPEAAGPPEDTALGGHELLPLRERRCRGEGAGVVCDVQKRVVKSI